MTRSRGSSWRSNCKRVVPPASGAGLPGLSREGHAAAVSRSGFRARALAYPVLSSMLLVCGLISGAGVARGQGPNHGASKFYPDSSREGRNPAPECGEPCAGQPVVRGDRDLSAGHRPVRRQGRQASQRQGQARAVDQTSDEFAPVRGSEGLLPSVARRSSPPSAGRSTAIAWTAMAERWFREGAAGATRLLRRVVEQAFCSSWGDEALELLGDLAFQDGRLEGAGVTASSCRTGRTTRSALIHPDPASIWRGSPPRSSCAAPPRARTARACSSWRVSARATRAAGSLTRAKGAYATILADRSVRPSCSSAQPDGRWPTFAGRSTDEGRSRPIDVGSLQWRVISGIAPSPVRLSYGSTAGTPCSPSPRPTDCSLIFPSCWATRCSSATKAGCWHSTSTTGRRLRPVTNRRDRAGLEE